MKNSTEKNEKARRDYHEERRLREDERRRGRLCRRSNFSNSRSRTILTDSLAKIEQIEAFAKAGTYVAITKRFAARVDSFRLDPDSEKRDKIAYVETLAWDHAGRYIHLFAYASCIRYEPEAFSLNLSHDVIEKALRSPKGFAPYLQDRITSEIRREYEAKGFSIPEFCFIVEGNGRDIPFHLHGVISAGPQFRSFLKRALLRAGGRHDTRRTQLRFKRMTFAAGWVSYLSKSQFQTADCLKKARAARGSHRRSKECVLGASQSLRRAARKWYEDARADEAVVAYPA